MLNRLQYSHYNHQSINGIVLTISNSIILKINEFLNAILCYVFRFLLDSFVLCRQLDGIGKTRHRRGMDGR